MSPPRVSVCIDAHDYEAYLAQAIESVLMQDFTDFELIVVDDCSTDRSFEIARGFAARDPRVRALQNAENLGMVRNRNVGLRAARGEYVKLLHADDYLRRPDALSRMSAVLDASPGVVLVASAMALVDEAGRSQGRLAWFDEERIVPGTRVIVRSLREERNLVGGPSAVMFRRARAGRGFDERLFHAADWEMWLHLLEQGSFGFIAEPLVAYRRHPRQQTEKDRLSVSQHEDHLTILDRYLERPYVRLTRRRKDYLRHRALAGLVRRSRRLGRTDAAARVAAYGPHLFRARHAWAAALRPFMRQHDLMARRLERGWRAYAGCKRLDRFAPGVNAVGCFQAEYGIGDSSRAFYRVVDESGVPAAFLNLVSADHRNQDLSCPRFDRRHPYAINLLTLHRNLGPMFFRHRHNIVMWYWELERFPARWHSTFELFDEVWVTTEFCRRSIADAAPIPVRRIDYPLYPAFEELAPDRAGLGLPPEGTLFLFNFDFHSVRRRKNPDGVIAAFRRAFDPARDDAVLVVKSINARLYPAVAADVKRGIQGLRVVWMDEHVDAARMRQLLATVDCYVSLHRSEGLGLGMAQAMGYGKPVIGTGYSGNTEFMTPDNSLLVKFTLTEIDRDYGVYEKGNVWAEPDLDHAAELMRRVHDHREESARIGERARQSVREAMNPENTRRQVMARLREIDPRLAG